MKNIYIRPLLSFRACTVCPPGWLAYEWGVNFVTSADFYGLGISSCAC